ncbi:hypothetical protein KC19_VG305800 [Ceratodon purpureus]|uniref:Uncharacterized protein n=1 Tax=Ceratodon purpureus TaxID=3225 RepID=A0A8T0HVZ5_CERPU|nr:hypothetical protein KC19_VG305800 [Ceratodon purpureus]
MENLVQHTFHVYDGLVGDRGVADNVGENGFVAEHDDPRLGGAMGEDGFDAGPEGRDTVEDDFTMLETALYQEVTIPRWNHLGLLHYASRTPLDDEKHLQI